MIVEPADWRSAPWGAAQGTTHEIARWPDGAGGFVARVSVADIAAPGPFTALPGYRRWLAVLDDGGGLELTIGARRWRGATGAAVTFDGGEPVHATLTRPARVWNLIVRADVRWSARWHAAYPDARGLPPGVAVAFEIASARTRITTSAEPISIGPEAPAIVVHLALAA